MTKQFSEISIDKKYIKGFKILNLSDVWFGYEIGYEENMSGIFEGIVINYYIR